MPYLLRLKWWYVFLPIYISLFVSVELLEEQVKGVVLNCHLNWKIYWFCVQPFQICSFLCSNINFNSVVLVVLMPLSPSVIVPLCKAHLLHFLSHFIEFPSLSFSGLRFSTLVSLRTSLLLFYWWCQNIFDTLSSTNIFLIFLRTLLYLWVLWLCSSYIMLWHFIMCYIIYHY